MLQYIVWAKDKRKSKGEFKYTPTTYNEQMEESKVMGMSFGDIFSKYKMDLVNNVDTFGYEVLNVKGRKTKAGKNMAFVKVRDNKSVHDLVIFNDRYKDIKAHNVYIMKYGTTESLISPKLNWHRNRARKGSYFISSNFSLVSRSLHCL